MNTENQIISEDELTDMFGEGGKEEVKEAFANTKKQDWELEIIEISKAWLVGLGYTVPPYNGMHSKEFVSKISNLLTTQESQLREELVGKVRELKDNATDYLNYEDSVDVAWDRALDQVLSLLGGGV